MLCTDRDIARESGSKYTGLKQGFERVCGANELAAHNALDAVDQVRGATPRRWNEVVVGSALPRLAKGPMTVSRFIAYAQDRGGRHIRTNKLAWKLQTRHPAAAIRNRFGIPDCPERVHREETFARKLGAPRAYDHGGERCSWMSHAVTNWIGNDAMVARLYCEVRRHNLEGELITIDGSITGKREERGHRLVDFELVARNRDGGLSAPARASAALLQ